MNGEMTSTNNYHAVQEFDSVTLFVEKLKILSNKIEQNSYIKYTSNKLKQIIEDAESPVMIIFLGKERVGKTTLINALIGRNLFSVGNKLPTHVNSLVRYGKKECIKAIFYDGSVAYFDLKHLFLFTNSDTFLAQIIRENLNYIEVYVNSELLKNVVLIDTVALEMNQKGDIYFSKSLLNRVDEIFLVLRNDSAAIDSEIAFLKKLYQKGKKPSILLNLKEYDVNTLSEIIEKEKKRYGKYVQEYIGVSALQAINAKRSHDMQLFIDSHINDLISKINDLSLNKKKRTRKIAMQFLRWLKQFEKEVTLIPEREPFLSASKNVKTYHKEIDIDLRTERDLEILAEYENEYKHVSGVLKSIQTLYQLLQTIEYETYLKDEQVENFVDLALKYHESVREYRILHSEYVMEQNYFERQQKKFVKKSIVSTLFTDEENYTELLIKKAENLNALQGKCKALYDEIKRLESSLIKDLKVIQNQINELTEKRLKRILKKVDFLNLQKKRERITIQRFVNKLSEFQCIVEAQNILREEIKPLIEKGELPYTPDELQQVLLSIDSILQVKLVENEIISKVEVELKEDIPQIKADFKENYPFYPLNLTQQDVISDIPPLPEIIDIEALKNIENL